MTETQAEFIDINRLRVGHYVFMDLGWISHPFPLNSFKIQSRDQIDTIRALGLERIRYSPQRSDPDKEELVLPTPAPAAALDTSPLERGKRASGREGQSLSEQKASLQRCERLFSDASRSFRQVQGIAHAQPEAARHTAESVVDGMVGKLGGEQENCIRLLSEKVGEGACLHAINVTVISLLLGKACGLDGEALRDVGLGALLHDIGKINLADRLRYLNEHSGSTEQQAYREHVRHGVEIGKRMQLPKGTLLVIGQHHECADGCGYPLGIGNERISPAARIVSLVDRYDEFCNPCNPAQAMTPYEAMSCLFAQRKQCFDGTILGIFVRMMGVYPPGSVVQLTDGRYALVVSVNASRPLKPKVIIHDTGVPREKAPVVDLGEECSLGIRRSLRALQLPKATFDYLSPRQRVCYFFEHGRSMDQDTEAQ